MADGLPVVLNHSHLTSPLQTSQAKLLGNSFIPELETIASSVVASEEINPTLATVRGFMIMSEVAARRGKEGLSFATKHLGESRFLRASLNYSLTEGLRLFSLASARRAFEKVKAEKHPLSLAKTNERDLDEVWQMGVKLHVSQGSILLVQSFHTDFARLFGPSGDRAVRPILSLRGAVLNNLCPSLGAGRPLSGRELAPSPLSRPSLFW